MNSKRLRSSAIYILIVIALGAFLYAVIARQPENAAATVAIARVAELVRGNEVSKIRINDDRLTVTRRGSGELLQARKETDAGLVETLANLGVTPAEMQRVDISVDSPRIWESWGAILVALIPLLLLGVFFFVIMRQAQGAGNQAFSFGKSRARMFTGDRPTVTFNDVAGNDEAKQELQEVVEFLKEPEKFAGLGARIPKGVLLVGPPGTGKTLMAKAVSGEAGVPFFSISGSEFVEMFVGVGASRVRDLFEQAKKNSPCIVFVDEIDAVGRHRGAGLGGSHDEREQTLNQILVEMDGFDTDTNVIIIAATNRPDILDPALLRPGRFDRRVTMDAPDVKGRRAILDVHVKGKPLATDVDLDLIAKETPGFAGADIENLVNEAAILAARRNRRSVGMAEFQEAVERVSIGPERRSRLISPREKEIVAFHEAGHAIAGYFSPKWRVTKLTIVPRGPAGGYAMILPEEESMFVTKSQYLDRIVISLGGRVAEEIRFGDITTGASEDLKQVTNLAHAMVTQIGMSEKLGPVQYGEREDVVFLGREISERRNYSDKVAKDIDDEVHRIVTEAHARCHELLSAHWDKLETLVTALYEVETVNFNEFDALMRGENPFQGTGGSGKTRQAPVVGQRSDESARAGDRRQDPGVDLGGTVPAPA